MDFLDEARKMTELRVKLLTQQVIRTPSLTKAIVRRNNEGFAGLIAEYKRISPSGVIRLDMDAYSYFSSVSQYATGFSVLTEPFFFAGHPIFLRIASIFNKPVLYKDFVIHEAQINEAYLNGASAVLVIFRLLNGEIDDVVNSIVKNGLEPLIEVDDAADALLVAEKYPNYLIGVNSRNLSDLAVSLDKSIEIIRAIRGKGVLIVAESGISNTEGAIRLIKEGANAILVGTAIMRNPTLAKELSLLPLK